MMDQPDPSPPSSSPFLRRQKIIVLGCLIGFSTLVLMIRVNGLQRGYLVEYHHQSTTAINSTTITYEDNIKVRNDNNKSKTPTKKKKEEGNKWMIIIPSRNITKENIPATVPESQASSSSATLITDTNTTTSITIVHFINTTLLNSLDGFSASWLQTTTRFLSYKMNVYRINVVEDGAFVAYRRYPKEMKQTLNWLDCSGTLLCIESDPCYYYGSYSSILFHQKPLYTIIYFFSSFLLCIISRTYE